MLFQRNPRASFTLIELLIVIAVVAILSVVVVLVLNPAELLKQARDSNRLADMQTLNKALILYQGDRGGSLGAASTTYLSLVDPAATSTAGTNCAGVGLSAPSGWNYHCAASSTVRKLDGTGWIPLNFSAITFSPPFGALPIDPTNTSSSGLYYMYIPGATTYALTATLNSSKYLAAKASGDGGVDPARLESGSNLALVAQGEGLVGWWKFDEGSSTTAIDSSGFGNTGTWAGAGQHSTTSAKAGPTGAQFLGSTDYLSMGTPASLDLGTLTVVGWVRRSQLTDWERIAGKYYYSGANTGSWAIDGGQGYLRCYGNHGGTWQSAEASAGTLNQTGRWYFIGCVFESTGLSNYIDGVLQYRQNASGTIASSSYPVLFGATSDGVSTQNYFSGVLDEMRIYNRALTGAEILAIYNAQR
jgi:prepilin-type N-terminal cleavage/methylation domain-containing protein